MVMNKEKLKATKLQRISWPFEWSKVRPIPSYKKNTIPKIQDILGIFSLFVKNCALQKTVECYGKKMVR